VVAALIPLWAWCLVVVVGFVFLVVRGLGGRMLLTCSVLVASPIYSCSKAPFKVIAVVASTRFPSFMRTPDNKYVQGGFSIQCGVADCAQRL
jgi:hypothetical protein